jgi:hypothetical protein
MLLPMKSMGLPMIFRSSSVNFGASASCSARNASVYVPSAITVI